VESAASSGSAHGPLSRIASPKRRGAPSSYAGSYAFSLSVFIPFLFSSLVSPRGGVFYAGEDIVQVSLAESISTIARRAYFCNYILCALEDAAGARAILCLLTHRPRNSSPPPTPPAAIKQLCGKVKSRRRGGEDTPGWRGDRKERTSRPPLTRN